MKKLFSTFLILLGLSATLRANNIQVNNVTLSSQNVTSHFSIVNFDVSWDHSWRTSSNEANYDGAWVFVKFRKANSNLWQHATLNYVTGGAAAACGNTEPTGSTLQTSADSKGVWIYRNANGTGPVNFTSAGLRWNYGSDGVLDNDSVEVRVYAVELVYCTQGAFSLGSGGAESYYFRNGNNTNPFQVTSENALTIGSGSGNLYYTGGGGDGLGPVPANFPKGYKAFWIMKHEFSQQLYADFLNTLDATRAATRNMGIPGTVNNYVPTYPERALNNFSGLDFLALLDWMAMRPMTELEFEKAARGYNMASLPNEYAWGNTTISSTSTVYNGGTANETPQQGNAAYYLYPNYIGRPMRCGAWARDTTVTREQAGASYYGVLELSGNVAEYCVTVGNTYGRAFTGLHGDGNLDNNGNHNVTNWDGSAIGVRGGSYGDAYNQLMVSDRYYANSINNGTRSVSCGGRGVRTAE
ncbi:MAG: SUMF1/EgtB/PvdO family nonheme iron enzyme [Bacteroidetes bacterium]|nr:SUMF1/EgtB/PvdO family nonheme iron enzyme [Bacteroidota bacterium]MBS1740825.1 SUMF1/EgtB/PvdO family nonheme iron enzyme [Bacteroidota bacterium]